MLNVIIYKKNYNNNYNTSGKKLTQLDNICIKYNVL